jgi:hypothetical protein
MGKPKRDSELSNNNNNGMFNTNNISSDRITNFCSCRFFMVLNNTISTEKM